MDNGKLYMKKKQPKTQQMLQNLQLTRIDFKMQTKEEVERRREKKPFVP